MKINIKKWNTLLFIVLLSTLSTASYAQKTIKILSYNVLFGLQKDSVDNIARYKELIADLDPDIIATQEMNGWTQKTLEGLANSYGHPYALQSKEEGFPVALSAKQPLVNFRKVTENMWHSFIYSKVQGLHIFVIHFSPFSYKKRLEEVKNIIAQTKEISPSEPILIMGDFNSCDESDADHYGDVVINAMIAQEEKNSHIRNLNNGKMDYSVLRQLKDAGFKDSYRLMNKEFTGSVPSFKDGNAKWKASNTGNPKRIDFLWVNDAAAKRVTKSIVLKNKLTDRISDHYPVYVELSTP